MSKFLHDNDSVKAIAIPGIFSENNRAKNVELIDGWLVVLGFNATLTAKVISWRSVTHECFLAFSHQY